VHVVGNEDAAASVDLQSIGPALVFNDERPFSVGGDAEDAAERDVDNVEIA